ncbi:MAG: substrate-binding domain-containing protein [Planctomycetota bacterium]
MAVRKTIGIAIDPEWPHKHHQGVLRGILEAGEERGWRCELDPFVGRAPGGRYDGIIARAGRSLVHYARRSGVPVVNVWVNSPDRTLPRVVPDQAEAGRIAAAHLLERGFRRFGFLGHPGDLNSMLLFEGFRTAVAAAGARCERLLVPHGTHSPSRWRRVQSALAGWIRTWRAPLGILAADDLHARFLIEAARRLGVRIPEEAGIVGCGNAEITCGMMVPALTSVEYGFERVGRRAVELLDRLMRGARPPARPVLVPPVGVVARLSTDVFAVDDPDVRKALRVIWELSRRPLKVAQILEAVPLSRRTLERRFRTVLGRGVHEQIVRAHVERARRLLAETDEPVKQVARDSGFRSPQQLSRVFRLCEGMTPLAFRRRHRGGGESPA